MSSEFDYDERQLIPRLVPLRTANYLSLNKTISIPKEMNDFEKRNFNTLISEWNCHKDDIDICIEILSYKIIFDNIKIPNEIINAIKNNLKYLNQAQLEMFNLYNSQTISIKEPCKISKKDTYKKIHHIRTSNNKYNKNPLLWCDLGYFYTTLGLREKAKQCFIVASTLNNYNRHVIRSTSRFYLHIEEYGIALDLIRKSPNIKNDVGLISAEIALSELNGTKSKFIDYGRRKIKDANISFFEKNELLAQIASLEFKNGKSKIGKRLVKECLNAPNENSLAQFEFLKKQYVIDGDFESKQFNVSCNHEALARNYLINNEYQKSLAETEFWISFQPFSLQPAHYGSFLASSFLEDYDKAISIVKKALEISPTDFTLLNNNAFALAHSNEPDKAIKKMNLINRNSLNDFEKAIFNATSGLIKIKQGNIEEGKLLYEKTINYFTRKNDLDTLARAKFNFGKALIGVENEESSKLIFDAYKLSKKINLNNLTDLIEEKHFIT